MPAQKRPLPTDASVADHQLPPAGEHELSPRSDHHHESPQVKEESDGEGGSASSSGEAGDDEYVLVKLGEVRKEVQCPICLGIIRKTRTVMECLHRFCRECIDKSMRLGNNECPACRTHCASRRSLRDDPNYDALISVLYPDIDKYEEEELALLEEEKNRNKKIQASIAETFQRQSEALGKRRSAKSTAVTFARRSKYRNAYGQNSYLRSRGRNGGRDTSLAGSDEEEDESNDGSKESSSTDERSPDVRPKRCKRWTTSLASPARAAANPDIDSEENDDVEMRRENQRTSPLRAGNGEMLSWGRGGVRSQTRHGNASGSNGRFVKGGRTTKMVEYLRNLDEKDNEFELHLTLLPMDEHLVPQLERPYLCCRPNLSISHLCKFIALQISAQAEQVEISLKKPRYSSLANEPMNLEDKSQHNPSEEFQVLGAQDSLAGLDASFISHRGDLVLFYGLKMQT